MYFVSDLEACELFDQAQMNADADQIEAVLDDRYMCR